MLPVRRCSELCLLFFEVPSIFPLPVLGCPVDGGVVLLSFHREHGFLHRWTSFDTSVSLLDILSENLNRISVEIILLYDETWSTTYGIGQFINEKIGFFYGRSNLAKTKQF
jgi:hypothetical protein